MTHLIHIDKHANGRKRLKKTGRCKPDKQFEHLASSNVVPEGYITSEDFRKRAIVKVNTFCAEHGIL